MLLCQELCDSLSNVSLSVYSFLKCIYSLSVYSSFEMFRCQCIVQDIFEMFRCQCIVLLKMFHCQCIVL